MQDIGPPKQVIQGFGPELIGKPVDDEDILDTQVGKVDGLTVYYCKSHFLRNLLTVRNLLPLNILIQKLLQFDWMYLF